MYFDNGNKLRGKKDRKVIGDENRSLILRIWEVGSEDFLILGFEI